MNRFIAGFIAGAVAFALLSPFFTEEQSPPVRDQAPSSTTSPSPDAAAARRADSQPATAPPVRDQRDLAVASDSANESVSDAPGEPAAERSPNGPRYPIDLPDTHAGFVSQQPQDLPKAHADLENEEVDASWAETVATQLRQFISSHPAGPSVSIVSLTCRTTMCEIVGTVYQEQGGDLWGTILQDMRSQAWFASNFSDSTLGVGGSLPGEHRFITLLPRIGTEFGPPVEY